jgi:hypothetical protein
MRRREPRFLVEHPVVYLWVIALVAVLVWGKGCMEVLTPYAQVASHRDYFSVPITRRCIQAPGGP